MSQVMSKLPNDATNARNEEKIGSCVSASHSILFEGSEDRCSVCDEQLGPDDDDADMPCRGRGLLVWARGEERRYEEPLLCPSCASAIGVTALQRWEIEEDEG
jgi:hypothetical protein